MYRASRRCMVFMSLCCLALRANAQEIICCADGQTIFTSHVIDMFVTSDRPTTGKSLLARWKYAREKCELEVSHEYPLLSGLGYSESLGMVLTGHTNNIWAYSRVLKRLDKIRDDNFDHIVALLCTSDGESVFVASSQAERGKPLAGRVNLWSLTDRKQLHQWTFRTPLTALAISSDETQLAVGTVEGTIEIINTHSRKGVTTIQGEKGAVRALSFSSEEKNLLSLQGDGSLMSWDLKNRQQRYRILEDDRFIMKIAVSPKGLLATVDSDERVTLRSVFTGRRIMRLNVEKAQSLTFSPDGMTLFVGLDNRELRAVTLDHLSK